MKRKAIILDSINVYRYDLSDPPKEWTVDYHNDEYFSETNGNKNCAGLFFL